MSCPRPASVIPDPLPASGTPRRYSKDVLGISPADPVPTPPAHQTSAFADQRVKSSMRGDPAWPHSGRDPGTAQNSSHAVRSTPSVPIPEDQFPARQLKPERKLLLS